MLRHKWESAFTLDQASWGFARADPLSAYMTASELLRAVVSTVAYGGNALINVGPAADGTIPVIFKERLQQLGGWLAVNGGGIFGSRPWRVQNETAAAAAPIAAAAPPHSAAPPHGAAATAAEIFYTASAGGGGGGGGRGGRGSTVYAFVLGWPAGGVELRLAAPRPHPNATVTLLEAGGGSPLSWRPLLPEAGSSGGQSFGVEGMVVSLTALQPPELLGHHQVWVLKLCGVS